MNLKKVIYQHKEKRNIFKTNAFRINSLNYIMDKFKIVKKTNLTEYYTQEWMEHSQNDIQ